MLKGYYVKQTLSSPPSEPLRSIQELLLRENDIMCCKYIAIITPIPSSKYGHVRRLKTVRNKRKKWPRISPLNGHSLEFHPVRKLESPV